jgi:hypothetical protein
MEHGDDGALGLVPDRDHLRRRQQLHLAAVVLEVAGRLLRQAHRAVLAGADEQPCGPLLSGKLKWNCGGRLKVLGPGRRTATVMVRPQRATALTAPAYLPTRQVSTSIGERVPGSCAASWVRLASSTHRHGIAPCAPACPLL